MMRENDKLLPLKLKGCRLPMERNHRLSFNGQDCSGSFKPARQVGGLVNRVARTTTQAVVGFDLATGMPTGLF